MEIEFFSAQWRREKIFSLRFVSGLFYLGSRVSCRFYYEVIGGLSLCTGFDNKVTNNKPEGRRLSLIVKT